MCSFEGFVGDNIIDHAMQIYLYGVGCLVFKTNIVIAIMTLGLLPLYIFFIFYFIKNWKISNKKVFLSISIFLSFVLSLSCFAMAMVIGMWG